MSSLMGMESMVGRIQLLTPEMILFAGSVVTAVIGLSRNRSLRDSLPLITCVALIGSIAALPFSWTEGAAQDAGMLIPMLGKFVKPMLAAIGVLLVLLGIGTVDRAVESSVARGKSRFDPQRVVRGEYYSFFLLSITGAMLLCNAQDLIWLFLAIELVSLPTYIMVTIGGSGLSSGSGETKAQEAGVKYFFLGAMSTAVFLYGFALLYGSTGSLQLQAIRDALAAQAAGSGIDALATVGVVLVILGLCFKIAAIPMHFYAPDVYEGAPTHVTAFLAFVPKVAGFTALILVLSCVGWSGHSMVDSDGVRIGYSGLPTPISAILWMVAVVTMTLGNVGALLQKSIKRTLAYSSIAHSGYMVIGLVAGAAAGIDSILFYLCAYGVMSTASFAALAALERKGEELNSFADIAGLRIRHPVMAWVLALSCASLVGLPPFIGFFGKVYLLVAALEASQFGLVVVAALNSAVSGLYYLRLAMGPLVAPASVRSDSVVAVSSMWPRVAAIICGVGTLIFSAAAGHLLQAAGSCTKAPPTVTTADASAPAAAQSTAN